MFHLVHDIDFVIAAVVILVIIFLSSAKQFSIISKSNKYFYVMLVVAMLTSLVDIALNVCETYTAVIPTSFRLIFRTMFNTGVGLMVVCAFRYVRTYQDDFKDDKRTIVDWVVIGLMLILFGISIVDMFTGITTYVDENGRFHNGPLYYLIFIIPAIDLIIICVTVIKNRNAYTKKQFWAIIVFEAVIIVAITIEYALDSDVLLTMFGVAAALFIIQMSLETPDYQKLIQANIEEKKAKQDAEQAMLDAQRLRVEAEQAKAVAEAAYADSQAAKQEALSAQQLAEEAKENALAANQAKSTFLARMSHEIRTPMNAILGLNQMIAKESHENEIVDYALDAERASENLLNIINDILDFSKIESGKLELIERDYLLSNILKEEYTLFSFKAKEKNLKLVFDIDKDLPNCLYGDDVRIKQVITNLLSNAIKYTDNGSVTLKVSLDGRGRSSAVIKFAIRDTGRGIKEEDIGKLYDAFERIEESRNRAIEGTGLGINICMQLLTLMGSKLAVESVYGLGSQFSFAIRQTMVDSELIGNFDQNDAKPENANRKSEIVYAPDAKILVVDDNMMNLKVFVGLLKETKMNIDAVSSGEEALKKTLETKYDLIFMDHLMPEMDGVETFNKIKEQENGLNHDTVQIALTANAIKGALEEYKGYGFADAAFKPAKLSEINEKLWEYLDRKLIQN